MNLKKYTNIDLTSNEINYFESAVDLNGTIFDFIDGKTLWRKETEQTIHEGGSKKNNKIQ